MCYIVVMAVMTMGKNIVCNVRMTEDMRYALKMVALKNKTTVQDILFNAAKNYLKENGAEYGPATHEPNAEDDE